VRAMGATPE